MTVARMSSTGCIDMSKCIENSPLGFTDCPFCGAKVEVRKSLKTGKAYWTCDGDHDVRACHSQVRLGPRPSRNLIDQGTRAAAPPKPQLPSSVSASPRPPAKPPSPVAVPARVKPPAPIPAPGAATPIQPGAKSQPAAPAHSPFDVWNNLLGRDRRGAV